MIKPDCQKAQQILRDAMLRVCEECGLQFRWDLFVTVTQASTSAIIAEVMNPDQIQSKSDVDRIVKVSLDMFEKMLREDLGGRLAHERKKQN